MVTKTAAFTVCLTLALLLLGACSSTPAGVSQDAVSGKWSGDYGPDSERREPITLELRWEDASLRGVVHAGVRSIPLTKASFKRETGDIGMEFDAQGNGGRTVHYVIDGKVNGNSITGTWSHDGQNGDFKVTKQ